MHDESHNPRDHRAIGRELDLFSFSPHAPAQVLWQPRGVVVWNELIAAWRELNAARGYVEVRTPLIYDADLWKQSGHWDKFRGQMFVIADGDRERGVKPMNCPGHIELYRSRPRSYRELPLRLAEAGLVHRNEHAGAVNGLLRARAFVIDDAHIFCTDEQLPDEIDNCLAFAADVYRLFDLEPRLELSTRPAPRIGSEEQWDAAEGALTAALERHGFDYSVNPGDGAFYGPKIDLHLDDSLGRSWQMGTVQIDYAMADRFALTYVSAAGADHRPVIVHRAIMGSLERFLAILLEHVGGDLPGWLAPVQSLVLPIADRHRARADELVAQLRLAGVRAEADHRGGPLGGRIREAERLRVPFVAVIGDREASSGEVAVRERPDARWSAPAADAAERIADAVRHPPR
jgi:threonyl-tRNA synthetase